MIYDVNAASARLKQAQEHPVRTADHFGYTAGATLLDAFIQASTAVGLEAERMPDHVGVRLIVALSGATCFEVMVLVQGKTVSLRADRTQIEVPVKFDAQRGVFVGAEDGEDALLVLSQHVASLLGELGAKAWR